MTNYWKLVNNVILNSDILIEVLDARMIEETRNSEVEKKIESLRKPLLKIANKADLISKEKYLALKNKYKDVLFFSSKKKLSTLKLKKKILEISKGQPVCVGVVGYPNVGKSSLINALKGRSAAPTSPTSGYTKGIQKIRVSKKIMLIDTPGVFPYLDKDVIQRAIAGTISPEKIEDPELVAMKLIEILNGKVEEYYGVEKVNDPEEALRKIALKKKKLLKGGIPDTNTMSRIIIRDWQLGKIKEG